MSNFKIKAIRNILWGRSQLCGICGKAIDRLDLATVDHIMPRFYDGRTQLNNSRLAHMSCNSERSHKIDYYSTAIAGLPKPKKQEPVIEWCGICGKENKTRHKCKPTN